MEAFRVRSRVFLGLATSKMAVISSDVVAGMFSIRTDAFRVRLRVGFVSTLSTTTVAIISDVDASSTTTICAEGMAGLILLGMSTTVACGVVLLRLDFFGDEFFAVCRDCDDGATEGTQLNQ